MSAVIQEWGEPPQREVGGTYYIHVHVDEKLKSSLECLYVCAHLDLDTYRNPFLYTCTLVTLSFYVCAHFSEAEAQYSSCYPRQ